MFGIPVALLIRIGGAAAVALALWYGYHSIRTSGYDEGVAHERAEQHAAEAKRMRDEAVVRAQHEVETAAVKKDYADEITEIERRYRELRDTGQLRDDRVDVACPIGSGNRSPAGRADATPRGVDRTAPALSQREAVNYRAAEINAARLRALQQYVRDVCLDEKRQ